MQHPIKCPTCAQVLTLRTRKDASGRLFFHCTECQPDMFLPEQLTLPLDAPRTFVEDAPVRKDAQ